MKKNTIRENVEAILREHVHTRSDDKALLLRYWTDIDDLMDVDGWLSIGGFLQVATPPESITRARRLVQQLNPELAPEEVVENRRQRETSMKDALKGCEVV
ncbi:MAG: hypothetical protein RR490_10755 [Niameybacter sp.]